MPVAMPSVEPPFPTEWSVHDLLQRLGGVPAGRVKLTPSPGTATEDDLRDRKLCELIDGTLVEKTMGFFQGSVGAILLVHLGIYLRENDLGVIAGADAMVRLGRQVRLPDVCFIRHDRLPGGELTREPAILPVAPDLCVEVLSPGNTADEMRQKREDYFGHGTRLVWEIDPATESVRVFTSVDGPLTLGIEDTLDGGELLPGFALAVRELFAQARRGPGG